MDENAKRARQKIGEAGWTLIMASVDSGTLDAQKMHDFAFGLGSRVGGNHKRRVGPERLSSDRSEMSRILGDWWQLDDDFGRMSVTDVTEKLIALFKDDAIQLNPLARDLEGTLNTNSDVAAAPRSEGTTSSPSSARQPGPVRFEPGPAAPGRVSLYNLLKPEVRKPVRGHDFLSNLAYECKFGEDFETYLEGLKPGTNPDMKVESILDA